MGVPVTIGGDSLPSLVGIGLTDPPNIGGGAVAPPVPASLKYKHFAKGAFTYDVRCFGAIFDLPTPRYDVRF